MITTGGPPGETLGRTTGNPMGQPPGETPSGEPLGGITLVDPHWMKHPGNLCGDHKGEPPLDPERG